MAKLQELKTRAQKLKSDVRSASAQLRDQSRAKIAEMRSRLGSKKEKPAMAKKTAKKAAPAKAAKKKAAKKGMFKNRAGAAAAARGGLNKAAKTRDAVGKKKTADKAAKMKSLKAPKNIGGRKVVFASKNRVITSSGGKYYVHTSDSKGGYKNKGTVLRTRTGNVATGFNSRNGSSDG